MNWKTYGVAVLNAFASAAAASIGSFGGASIVGVPAKQSFEIAGITAAISGIVSACKWIAQHPLPGAPTP